MQRVTSNTNGGSVGIGTGFIGPGGKMFGHASVVYTKSILAF